MSAKYIVFSSNSKVYMSGGDVRYFVSEASARCLDESIRSIAKINYKKRAFMEEREYDKNSGQVMLYDDGDSFWDCVLEYIDHDTVILVWDDEYKLISDAGSTRHWGKKLRIRKIRDITNAMLLTGEDSFQTIPSAFEGFSISFDISRTGDKAYVTDCLTRLFRKVVHIGKCQCDTFEELICLNQLFTLAKCCHYKYSRKKLTNAVHEDIEQIEMDKMIAVIQEMGFTAEKRGSEIDIQTDIGTWWFDHTLNEQKLYYITKNYYQGIRHLDVKMPIPKDASERSKLILNMVKIQEDKLSHGVGNAKISEYLQELSCH